ncbi:MAG: (2Fe-2S)-binding protein [Planctomycetes bacterium]|nr:(2Fe-2S)-binding protein [Planctomycetota bacterium]
MIDTVTIIVDGEALIVDRQWTLAVALMRRGPLAFRSSVTGEARGPLCGMGTCFECRVEVDGRPSVRSCLVDCREGLEVRTSDALR